LQFVETMVIYVRPLLFCRGVAFIHGPDWLMKKTGYTYAGLMHGADWLPTLADIAGFTLNGTTLPGALHSFKPQLPVDGVSQWAAFNGGNEYEGQVGPRSQLVYGNSTNACSWKGLEDSNGNPDPRLAKYTDSKIHTAGVQLGCGFGVRDGGWKLIRGYGGGPDSWCNRTGNKTVPDPAGKPGFSCASFNSTAGDEPSDESSDELGAADSMLMLSSTAKCTTRDHTCSNGEVIASPKSNSTDGSDCCAKCIAATGCIGWIFNKGTCYLKSTWGRVFTCTQSNAGGVTGNPIPAPGPAPGPAPAPVTECPNGYCLFDVQTDPV
jgi:hypothetical protein